MATPVLFVIVQGSLLVAPERLHGPTIGSRPGSVSGRTGPRLIEWSRVPVIPSVLLGTSRSAEQRGLRLPDLC